MREFLDTLFPGLIPATKEEQLARELVAELKHLPGQHDQMSHGGHGTAMAPDKGGGEGGGEAQKKAPMFETYQDATDWIETRSRDYKSKNEFLASEEYRNAYPAIKNLYDSEKKGFALEAKRAMASVGVAPGDKVSYVYISPFMGSERYSGTLQLRNGIPYVKLDAGQTTMNGKQSTRWHKGWTKT